MTAPDAPRPPRRPRAVFLDLDGTLLDGDRRIHPRSRAAIAATIAAGTPVVLASGRMYRSMLPYALDLGVTAPLICYQGAMVREVGGPADPLHDGVPWGRLVAEDPLDGAVARRAVLAARAQGWHRQVFQDDRLWCEEDRPEAHLYAGIAGVPIAHVDDLLPLLARPATKMICVVTPAEAPRCVEVMAREVDGAARITRSLRPFVELVNPTASKSRALRSVCASLGVSPDQAVAVGDAPNDIDMLDAAGYAVAVRSDWPEVPPHADVTCAPPEEGGVAEVLEALGLTGAT